MQPGILLALVASLPIPALLVLGLISKEAWAVRLQRLGLVLLAAALLGYATAEAVRGQAQLAILYALAGLWWAADSFSSIHKATS